MACNCSRDILMSFKSLDPKEANTPAFCTYIQQVTMNKYVLMLVAQIDINSICTMHMATTMCIIIYLSTSIYIIDKLGEQIHFKLH